MTLVTLAFSKTGVFHVWFYICSFESLCPAVSFGFHCKTDFCCVPKWREGQLDFFFWFAQVADEYMFSLEESKKSKGRRQPLSKLPRHHPLVLQDCVSDDELPEQLTPEEEAEETEAWAKPLSQLWQNRPPNFEAEKEFNEAMAQQAPHCAVCMIFQTYHQVEFGGFGQSCGSAPDLAPQTQRTKPLIPEMCFTSTGCSTDINLSTPYLEEDGTSLLVSCKKCSVRVHARLLFVLITRRSPAESQRRQMGPCLMCSGDSGSKICQHCRKKSSGCEQNSPAPLQTEMCLL